MLRSNYRELYRTLLYAVQCRLNWDKSEGTVSWVIFNLVRVLLWSQSFVVSVGIILKFACIMGVCVCVCVSLSYVQGMVGRGGFL